MGRRRRALDARDLELAIRALSIPFDVALAALLFFIARGLAAGGSIVRDRAGLLAAGFYAFNPAVVLTGPYWGQVDGMGALPMVGALLAVARGRLVTAAVLAVIAGLAGLITFIAVLLPLGLGPSSYLELMGETFRRYPFHSGFAFNPWGMVFGFNHDDGPWFMVGTLAEVAAIGASLWLLRSRRDLVGLLAVGSLIALTLYFVPTRAHERYLYGAIPLIAPLAALVPRLRAPFLALSATFFVTLAYVLANSPYRILPGPRIADFPAWAISAMAAIMTASGIWMAWRLVALLRTPRPDGPAPMDRPAGASIAASG